MVLIIILLVVFLISIFLFTLNETVVGSLCCIVGFLTGLQLLCHIDILSMIKANPLVILTFLSLYLVLGVLWGIIKWWFFVKKKLREYKQLKIDYINNKRGNEEDFFEWNRPENYKPKISKNKERWLNWVICWPVSIVIYLLGDLLVDLFTNLYEMFANLLQSISDKVWKEFDIK